MPDSVPPTERHSAPGSAACLVKPLAVGVMVAGFLLPTTALDATPQRHHLPRCTGIVNQQCRSHGDAEPIIDPCHVPSWVDRRTASSYPCPNRHRR